MKSRRLGRAPSADTLASGCREGEIAIKLAGGDVWAFPGTPPDNFSGDPVINPEWIGAYAEIVQAWPGDLIQAEYHAAGGRNMDRTTGEMALIILGACVLSEADMPERMPALAPVSIDEQARIVEDECWTQGSLF